MAPSPSHSQSLLPNPRILILDRVERDSDRFQLRVHVEQEPSCPVCGEVSQSRHSVYSRRLQDFPWQGVAVELWVTVGRFRCRNSSCPRKIFCERLPRIGFTGDKPSGPQKSCGSSATSPAVCPDN